jgi:uncharacterized protein (DUF1499 family)
MLNFRRFPLRFKLLPWLGCLLLLTLGLTAPAWAAPSSALATLPGLGHTFTGQPSPSLGVRQGQLSKCPRTPNCVVSQNVDPADEQHGIEPIRYGGDRTAMRETLLKVLTVVPNTVVTQTADDYIRYESTSKLLGFVDDGEFYLPPDSGLIQVRGAARMGESDLGVNRRRIEQIRLALKDLGAVE